MPLFEQNWAYHLLRSIMGGAEFEEFSVSIEEFRLFMRDLWAYSTPLVKLGFHAAVLLFTVMPLLFTGRPFFSLDDTRRQKMIQKFSSSKNYLVSQMLNTLKVMACFCTFRYDKARNLFP